VKVIAEGEGMNIVEERELRSIDEVMENGSAKCIVCGKEMTDEPALMLFAMNDIAVTDLVATVVMHPECMLGLGAEGRMFTVRSEVIRMNLMRSMVQAAEMEGLADSSGPVC